MFIELRHCRCMHWKEWIITDPEKRMKGPIYREPANLLETVERSKGNEPDINSVCELSIQIT